MAQVVKSGQHVARKKPIVARLSVVDQHIPDIYQNEALFFECSDNDAAMQALQKGLDETVAAIPFLAGEVYEDAKQGNAFFLEWPEDHARIAIEQVDGSDLPSMIELKRRRFPLHLLGRDLRPAAAKPTTESGIRKKAFATSCAQVDGGIILSHAFHHVFVDGYGLHRIIEKWAGLTARSGQRIHIAPREPSSRIRLDEAVRQARKDLVGSSQTSSLNEMPNHTPPILADHNLPPPVLESRMKILVLSSRKLNRLGEQLRAHVSQPFSQNTLLVAVIWQAMSVVRCRRLSKQVSIKHTTATSEVGLMVDCRRILENHLPGSATWLGNQAVALSPRVLYPASAFSDRIIDGRDKQDDGEASSAPQVRYHQSLPRLIKRLSNAHSNHGLKQVVTSLGTKLDKVASKDFNLRSLRESELELNGLHLIFSSILEIDTYHYFGPALGRPLAMRTPGQGIDGLCIVLPRKRGDGFTESQLDEMEVQVFLREDDLDELVKDEVLMQLFGATPI